MSAYRRCGSFFRPHDVRISTGCATQRQDRRWLHVAVRNETYSNDVKCGTHQISKINSKSAEKSDISTQGFQTRDSAFLARKRLLRGHQGPAERVAF